MSKLRITLALMVALIGSLFFIVPQASADFDGKMTFSEFIWIDTVGYGSATQSEIQDNCNCTGVLANTFDRNGNPAKRVNYLNTDDYIVKVWYVKRDDDRWHAYNKAWCNSDGCLSTASVTALQTWVLG